MAKEGNFAQNSGTVRPTLPFFGADVAAETARTS